MQLVVSYFKVISTEYHIHDTLVSFSLKLLRSSITRIYDNNHIIIKQQLPISVLETNNQNHFIFAVSALRPIQSIRRNGCGTGTGTKMAGHFWSKSVLL